jgi:hypothetical protein
MSRNNRTDKAPNFFIVGAPKCGTSAMFHYLEQHPVIFMYPRKEPDFFAEDLKAPQNRHEYSESAWDTYLNLFHQAQDESIIGEGTTWYLYSSEAASRIHDFNPDAKILIMIRNPTEQMHSLHSQLVYMGVEKISSFDNAVTGEALEDRTKHQLDHYPRYMPPTMTNKKLLYKDIAKYADQIQRYWDVFGRDQVHIVLHDDLKQDPSAVYKQVLEFLQIDPTFEPEFKFFNPNKSRRFKSDAIQRFRLHPVNLWLVRTLLPARVREESFRAMAHAWGALNTKYHPREGMEGTLKKELVAEFSPEIRKLESLLDRDLSHWTSA